METDATQESMKNEKLLNEKNRFQTNRNVAAAVDAASRKCS